MKKDYIKVFKDLEILQLKLLQSRNEKEKLDIYVEIKQLLEQIKRGYALKDTLVFTYQTALGNVIKEQEQTIRDLKKTHEKEIKNIYKKLDKA